MNAAASEIQERELPASATDQALVQAISKAELDQAITTAHAFPRSVKKFMDECMELATLNSDIADDCIYALPRREKDQGTGQWVVKNIEGPSARLAEIVLHSWGNCRGGARVVNEGREFITAQGVFHDLQKNVHITFEVQRRITTSRGQRYSSDMIGVTGNAACSIALRNAVFKGVPKALWNPVYEAARKVCMGDQKTLANRRADAFAFLQKQGATPAMILQLLDVKGIEDVTLEHLVILKGVSNSIREGEITVEQAFAPKPDVPGVSATRTDALKDTLRAKNGSAAGNSTEVGSQTADVKTPTAKDQTAAVPHFDPTSAIAEIKKASSLSGLETAMAAIRKDFADSNRELPVAVHAAHSDRKAALEQEI